MEEIWCCCEVSGWLIAASDWTRQGRVNSGVSYAIIAGKSFQSTFTLLYLCFKEFFD